MICKRKPPEMVNLVRICECPNEFGPRRAEAPESPVLVRWPGLRRSTQWLCRPEIATGACVELREKDRGSAVLIGVFAGIRGGPYTGRLTGAPPSRHWMAGALSRARADLAAVVPQSAGHDGGAPHAPAVLSAAARAANHSCIRRLVAAGHSRRADALSRQTEADEQKRARLAAALRENLKRRKAQARARRASETEATDEPLPAQAESSRS